jgi:hypothetical protein
MIPVVPVNIFAVFVAAIASMAVGMVWYMPSVFGNTWMKLANVHPKKSKNGPGKAMMIAFLCSFAKALIAAYVLSLAAIETGFLTLGQGWAVTIVVWFGFTAVNQLTHDTFESRQPTLFLLNVFHDLASFLAIATVLLLWR